MSKIIRNIIIIASILVMSTVSISFGFSDIEGHWGKEAIVELSSRGVINGYEDGTYKPNKMVTREEFAKMLVEALDLKEDDSNVKFVDVDSTRWSHKYIQIASEYLTGYKVNGVLYFKPTASSVREDVAVAVVLAQGLGTETPDYSLLNQFSDKDKISDNLKKYVAIAIEHEIMRGKGGYFDPQGSLTRAELAQLLLNISEKVVIEDEINEEEFIEDAQFAAFKSEMGALKDMMTTAVATAKGEEAIKGNNRTNEQLYNFIARGGYNVLTLDENGEKKWLIQSDAKAIQCTKIEPKYAKDVLGAELPTRFVKTTKSSKEQMSYFVTPKGEVFCWPPYEYNGKCYVNEKVIVTSVYKEELGFKDATKTREVMVTFGKPSENVRISNASDEKAIVYKRNSADQDGIGVWYPKAGKIEGIDFSKYDNTTSVYLGDINKDGRVDFDDGMILDEVIYITKDFDSIECRRADLNLDGVVNELDYIILHGYLFSKIESLPHTCKTYTVKYKDIGIDKEEEHRKISTCECKKASVDLTEPHNFVKGKCECGYEKVEEPKPKNDYDGTIYEDAVKELLERGIIGLYEDGTFQPNKVVTRAEFAKFLVLEEGLEKAADVARGATNFSDVSKDHWASGYINVASEYGFISGYPDGTFAPDETVTYAEAITYVLGTLGYSDVIENKGTWPTNYISKAKELKLLDNVEYRSYSDKATRGNVVILLYNMLDTERWEVETTITGKDIKVTYGSKTLSNGGTTTVKAGDKVIVKATPSDKISKIWYSYNGAARKSVSSSTYTLTIPTDAKAGTYKFMVNAVYSDGLYIDNKDANNTKSEVYYFKVEEKVSEICGDVDGDGELTAKDRMTLARYLDNWDGYEVNKKNSDVNLDGKVDEKDLNILQKYFSGVTIKLPHEKCTFTNGKCACGAEKEEEIKPQYGDVNGDGKINSVDSMMVQQYVAGELKEINKELADVDSDGKVTEKDSKIIFAYSSKKINQLPHKCTFINGKCACGIEEEKKPMLGDVNGNGEIDVFDAQQVLDYSGGNLKEINKELADVDDDGKITKKDAVILLNYYVGNVKQLPHKCTFKNGTCDCGFVDIKSIPVGSYIKYSANGYDTWRVLYNNNGQLDIISVGSVGDYTLKGNAGYIESVSKLNDFCKKYATGIGVSARCFGSTSSSTAKIKVGSNEWTFTGSPYEDRLYETDVNQVKNNGLVQTDKEVWLASRAIEGTSLGTFGKVRTLKTDGNRESYKLQGYYLYGWDNDSSVTKGVRPIVSLDDDLECAFYGDGKTAATAYELQ